MKFKPALNKKNTVKLVTVINLYAPIAAGAFAVLITLLITEVIL